MMGVHGLVLSYA